MNETQTSTWDKVMAMKAKDTRHKGISNTITQDEMNPILGTVEFFGGSVRQSIFDLWTARYRVFDWLAMCVMGDRISSKDATKVLVHSFLKVDGDINKWIDDLATTDYDIDESWKEIEL